MRFVGNKLRLKWRFSSILNREKITSLNCSSYYIRGGGGYGATKLQGFYLCDKRYATILMNSRFRSGEMMALNNNTSTEANKNGVLQSSESSTAAATFTRQHSTAADSRELPQQLLSKLPVAFQSKFHFINGDFVSKPNTSELIDIFNPNNGSLLLQIPSANQVDVDNAVQAAHSAMTTWAYTNSATRASYLHKIASLVESNSSYLAVLESLDTGKPIRESEVDMNDVVSCFKVNAKYAEEFASYAESPLEYANTNFRCKRRYEPYGVVGLITPWNYPLLMAMQKVAAALAAGCTCILKPSEYASLTCIEFGRLCKEANLPAGVFNLLTGLGRTTGDYLVSHRLIKKISFTGSVRTGRSIMKTAADMIKPVHLELGGKSPMIVFEDVDINATIDWILMGVFWCAGQVCSATSRVLIHESIYELVCDKLKSATEKLTLGPYDSSADVGPLISQTQFNTVKSYLNIAKQEQLKLLTGTSFDELNAKAGSDGGYFVRPTIFADVPTTSQLWQEEIFGPVLCIRPFSSEQDAVAEANNTPYGLAASVMTANPLRRTRIINQLEAGFVWGNCSQPVGQTLPFGGYKLSGFGRECGIDGFKEFLQSKTVVECDSDYSEQIFVKE